MEEEGCPEAPQLLKRHVAGLQGRLKEHSASIAFRKHTWSLVDLPHGAFSCQAQATAATHLVEPCAAPHNLSGVGQAGVRQRVCGNLMVVHVQLADQVAICVHSRHKPGGGHDTAIGVLMAVGDVADDWVGDNRNCGKVQ